MADSFPNAEEAFCDAFQNPDPTPKLLELISAHPRGQTITDLVSFYHEFVTKSPTQVNRLAGVMVEIKSSKGFTVVASDNVGNLAQQEIAPVLATELADYLGGFLAEAKDTFVTPSNEYLIASLLSATSMIYGLCDSPAQAGAVAHGLQLKDRRHRDAPESKEVLVLGMCLQLLVAGSYLYGPTGTDTGKIDVLTALQDIKEEGIVKDANGQILLEATVRQAKDGFKADVKDKDAWNILFPQEA
ncbi:hypothetical protein M413DRAFT_448554 [Hebeloma cylindrosporum]|uniref:Uncharacterized protein n=1 Tax=Hebeloma cylindrosporum TaxID=76867 RepID=A0A0C3BZN5_HEBCY|nr:hypothetical protein M413DRAFT_448554 [Hebeloma cylindrosporum h7]